MNLYDCSFAIYQPYGLATQSIEDELHIFQCEEDRDEFVHLANSSRPSQVDGVAKYATYSSLLTFEGYRYPGWRDAGEAFEHRPTCHVKVRATVADAACHFILVDGDWGD